MAQNPQSNTCFSTIYCKEYRSSGQLEIETSTASNLADIEELTYYIMYVPEGYAIDLNLPFTHPEWIMAYKYAGQSTHGTAAMVLFNLQKLRLVYLDVLIQEILLYFLYTAQNINPTTSLQVKFQGLVRWWTKAN